MFALKYNLKQCHHKYWYVFCCCLTGHDHSRDARGILDDRGIGGRGGVGGIAPGFGPSRGITMMGANGNMSFDLL